MNDLEKVPSKSILPFNKKQNIVLYLAVFLVVKNVFLKDRNLYDIVHSFNLKSRSNFNLSKINMHEVRRKVDILLKTAPYLPETVIHSLNKIVPTYEKINRVVGLLEFLNNNASISSITPSVNLSSTDKIKSVLSVVNEEFPNNSFKSITPIIDIVLNFDKYKGLLEVFTTLSDPNSSELNLENIINAVAPIFGENNDKFKDILPMIELFQALSTSEDNTNNEA